MCYNITTIMTIHELFVLNLVVIKLEGFFSGLASNLAKLQLYCFYY